MSGMGRLFATYIEAVMKAYGLNKHEAYIFAGKRTKGFVDGYLIKNDDAHTVVEDLEQYGREGAMDFGDRLHGV
jgi:hypothetical protein